MTLRGYSVLVYAIWLTLLLAFGFAIMRERWSLAFISFATLALSFLPVLFEERFRIKLPVTFFAGIVVFVFGTLFLGEAYDFYDLYWWWDIALHGGSAIGFGLIGFIFIFMMFEGDRYAAPHWALALMAFCVAVSVGAIWEIFEFAMDQTFGTNMQKSGLMDTMGDLIMDCLGAAVGAGAGYAYLEGRDKHGLPGLIREFVEKNRTHFKKWRR